MALITFAELPRWEWLACCFQLLTFLTFSCRMQLSCPKRKGDWPRPFSPIWQGGYRTGRNGCPTFGHVCFNRLNIRSSTFQTEPIIYTHPFEEEHFEVSWDMKNSPNLPNTNSFALHVLSTLFRLRLWKMSGYMGPGAPYLPSRSPYKRLL